MFSCEACGKEVDLPYTCHYCLGFFCADHQLPKSHKCTKKPIPQPNYILSPNSSKERPIITNSEQQVAKTESVSSKNGNRYGIRIGSIMPTVIDSLIDAPISKAIEEFNSVPNECKFANYVCTNGWFVKKKFFKGYDGFKATDVCWVYPLKVKQSINFVPNSNYWHIILKIKSGKIIDLMSKDSTPPKENLMPADSDFYLRVLQRILPWGIFGYSEYFNECWNKHNELFLNIHDKRLALIQTGLEKGYIIFLPDGSIATMGQPITLPTIGNEV
jgi:hypothetical protein